MAGGSEPVFGGGREHVECGTTVFVGRTPWSAADPPVGLFGPVHPTIRLRLCCQRGKPAAGFLAGLSVAALLPGSAANSSSFKPATQLQVVTPKWHAPELQY